MPVEAITAWFWTRDMKRIALGERAFDVFALRPGIIASDGGNGWFVFRYDCGATAVLDQRSICSIGWAQIRYPAYL